MADDVFVRVAVRIRPMLPKEVLHKHQVWVRLVPGSSQVLLGTGRRFSFEHAFGPQSSQDEVYEACVRPMLDSLLEGYNTTVFCYGQTGSGKTYTLEGGGLADEGGIIDRVAHDLFYLLEQSSDVVQYSVSMSYLELYKEELRDLLELPTVQKELHIREDDKGNTVVVGVTETSISSAEEFLSTVETGNALRHMSTTSMNEQSSRSHTVLSLLLRQRLHGDDPARPTSRFSKLCLVDLAGSERAYKTENTGLRLKESAHINTGLLALGNVIRALTDPHRNRNSVHVPYRDAKITRLLRDALGGHAHTLMIACVSPSEKNLSETLNVLHFASKARHIRNRPSSGNAAAMIPWDPGEARMGELEFEVQTLRELLKEKQNELQREQDKTKAGDRLLENFKPSTRPLDKESQQFLEVALEAAALLDEVLPTVADTSLKHRAEQWHERLNALNKLHQTSEGTEPGTKREQQQNSEDEMKLREELSQCKEAVAIAEKILQQKEADLKLLKDEMEKLDQECEVHLRDLEAERRQSRIKTEQLVNQQILIERLQGLKSSVLGSSGSSGSSDLRVHSAPLPRQSCALRPLRKTHSSPSLFSLERVMAAFRMRGQLLLAELDEKQEVYTPFTDRQDGSERSVEEEDGDVEEELLSKMGFRRSINRTWTSRQKKRPERSSGLKQESDEPLHSTKEPQPDLRTKHLNTTRCSVTRRRIQELNLNMKMKEELIKELAKTDKLSQAVHRHSLGADTGPAEALTRIWEQSQRVRTEVYHSLQHLKQQRTELQTHRPPQTPQTEPRQLSVNRRLTEDDLEKQSGDRDWLEELEEHVLKRRAQLEDLNEEQRNKEKVQQKRQVCLQQKKKLEMKRLLSSQALNKDLMRMSVQLDHLEAQILSERRAPGVSIEELRQERAALQKQRDTLEAQLNQVLTPEEQHCLLEMEEALETLDAALEFKNKNIQKKQEKLCASGLSDSEATHLHTVLSKLKDLTPPEMSELFTRYFNKVVRLREAERSLQCRCDELELQTVEQNVALREMEGNLQRLALDTDRRLTQQHRQHQGNIQLLLSQLKEIASKEEHRDIQSRLQNLEKELFFYKNSSRQLKKQLRVLSASQTSTQQLFNSQRDTSTETPDQQHAATHIPTTYTKVNATVTARSQQKPGPFPLYLLKADQNTASFNSSGQSEGSAHSSLTGEKLTQVRVPRRGLRRVSPARLQCSQSTTRGQHSTADSSTDTTLLEDSIEVTRRTEG